MEANSAASDDFIARVFDGEIADPGHLDGHDALVVLDIANRVTTDHSLEQAIAEVLDHEHVDDPNVRALVRGHLLCAAAADPDKFFPSPDGPETETDPTRAPGTPEKVLTPDQRASLFSTLQARFTSDTERYKRIEWPKVKTALETAGEKTLYALFELEENGHEVGVVKAKKDGKQGFRFDSCSKESPAGIRDIVCFRAAAIVKQWSGDGAVDLDLMEPTLFAELKEAGIITNAGTWDHLKTDAKTLAEDLAWYGYGYGIIKHSASVHFSRGGFRCSLWVPEAQGSL